MPGGGRRGAGERQRESGEQAPHGFCTVTVTLEVPVAFAESRTVTRSVLWPLGVPVVTQGKETGLPEAVSCHTVVPPTVSVYTRGPDAVLSFQIVTHCVPLTVCPADGVVMKTPNVPPEALLTVTVRVAEDAAPVESVTVRPSVRLPLATVVVFQENVAVVELVVVVKTCEPSTVSRYANGATPPLTAMPTLTVALTVAPAAGLVKDATGAVPFCTVTLRVAVAEVPAVSVTVRPSVWPPLARPVVF